MSTPPLPPHNINSPLTTIDMTPPLITFALCIHSPLRHKYTTPLEPPAARSVVPSAHGINAVVVYTRGALASLEFYINIDITYVYR